MKPIASAVLALSFLALRCLAESETSEGERLHAIFDSEWEYNLKVFPFMATFVGDPRYVPA